MYSWTWPKENVQLDKERLEARELKNKQKIILLFWMQRKAFMRITVSIARVNDSHKIKKNIFLMVYQFWPPETMQRRSTTSNWYPFIYYRTVIFRPIYLGNNNFFQIDTYWNLVRNFDVFAWSWTILKLLTHNCEQNIVQDESEVNDENRSKFSLRIQFRGLLSFHRQMSDFLK
jgi:hypothetical protein